MRVNFRDCKAWEEDGLPLSTTSNEACKLFDAAISQFMGFYDDDSFGGLEATLAKMGEADPSFVLGRALRCGMRLVGETTRINKELKEEVNEMVTLAASSKLTKREKLIVDAVQWMEKGELDMASDLFEQILIDHPTDALSLVLNNGIFLFRGLMVRLRDNWTRCLPYWNANSPLYEYFLSHMAFGFEETFLYPEAEKFCRQSLQINPHVGWSTHTLAHVYEMQSRSTEGVEFLTSTSDNWKISNNFMLGHTSWHLGLYHYQQREFESALSVFDERLIPEISPKNMLSIYDASSLLYRLELEGVNVGNRWKSLTEASRAHVDEHVNSFTDTHLLMTFIGNRDEDSKQKFLESLKDHLRDGSGTFHAVLSTTGQVVVDALLAYEQGSYAQVVELIRPVKYKVWELGGSYAQRDILNLLLIHSALKSTELRHRRLGRMLLAERQAFMSSSPLTDHLMARAAASCEDD